MASQRAGPRVFGRSGDAGSRDGVSMETPKPGPIWGQRRPEASPQPSRTIPQPKTSSRLPLSLSSRRPSDGQSERPRLGQQPQSRVSIGSAASLGITHSHAPTSSVSSISRLPALAGLKPRNVLRRKHSGLSQDLGSQRKDSVDDSIRTTSSSDSDPRSLTSPDSYSSQYDRGLTQSPMEIRIAHQVELPTTHAHTVTIYPELDRYREVKPPVRDRSPGFDAYVPIRLATHDLPPPTPLFSGTSSQLSAFSGSPSTRWSESPGPGPYSRDTTPTSISSQSPGLVAPLRSGGRLRHMDPTQTRPPVTRRRTGSISNEVDCVSADPHGLSLVREVSTSSSSNSTVRAGGDSKDKKDTKKNKRLSALPPPTPPPRQSSHKAQRSRDEQESPLKPAREANQPQTTSPSPAKAISSLRARPGQPSQSVTSPKSTPPVRPSRDGILDLDPQFGQQIPVIHSNLSASSIPERRQSGLLAPSPVVRPVLSSSLPDRPSYLSRRPPPREPTPSPRPALPSNSTSSSKPESVRGTRTPSPGVSAFKSRFPIFGRRTKTTPEPSQQDKTEKTTRKGPAAGTGHEGYGRLGHTRRKSSNASSIGRVIPGTMSSQESLTNDPFLKDRMAPVIIAGGEVIENRNTSSEIIRAESSLSVSFRRPSVESRNDSQISLSSRDPSRLTLWPSPIPRGTTQTPSLSSRRPSESSDSEALNLKPTLALRRSMQRLKAGAQEPPRVPKPIVIRPQVVSPSAVSLDASIMSDDSIFDPSREPTVAINEPANNATVSGPKKLIKRARSPRKWNFFSRSQSQPAAEKKTESAATVAATVKTVQAKPVAFYTLIDSSEQEDAESPDLQQVLLEAKRAVTPPISPRTSAADNNNNNNNNNNHTITPAASPDKSQKPKLPASKVPASPTPGQAITSPRSEPAPTPILQPARQMSPQRPPPPRPSRLPQVGRIPKVVKARPEQVSPKSFSRPFNSLAVQQTPAKQAVDSVAVRPTAPQLLTPEMPQVQTRAESPSNISALIHGIPRLTPVNPNHSQQEFISFSPRKDSECTITTTSSSSGGLLAYTDATAVVPDANAPLSEDEIWDEYNDILGEDIMRFTASSSSGSARGQAWPKPLHLDNRANGKRIDLPLESPTLSPPPLPSLISALRAGMKQTSSSVYSSDMAEEVRLMLDNGPSSPVRPSAPPVLSPIGELSDTPDNKAEPDGPLETHQSSNSSESHVRLSDTSSCSQDSEDSSPLSQVNLRVGSMTVSKWLTFGHVLFSPIRDELIPVEGSLKRPSILVVDGLGNDDWSFYAAETYPAATFFNLSPRAPLPAGHRSSAAFPLSPPNHHQVQYLSHLDKFPFGGQTFTSVVFRFPVAAPESHYRNIISEARRVLKPGGFIELSILDVDLNNMGNRGRRTVRRLKERIHTTAPETSLGSTSDLILRLIGRKGFQDIKTCRVGVPVASTIARSSGSERSSDNGGRKGSLSAVGGTKSTVKAKKDERSLPELMNDESPVADESITKMVAKVGRWWYSSCYENAAAVMAPLSPTTPKKSMWNDKALLAECEEWGTSLKLMVCHARVPDGRARVASI
ncbi:hypothetical protein QBC38DRAFT_214234 [Podospora fimiseda]|uniref:Methyltransferase type 11 domain-containing protein n=1 Tax=Podospora fimiseda TaxID=252190 RepID=A0AAN7BNY6_9PEZI|nr:hypothetical protein QBC38DRAFT_214234 [Podospora fimiseda]